MYIHKNVKYHFYGNIFFTQIFKYKYQFVNKSWSLMCITTLIRFFLVSCLNMLATGTPDRWSLKVTIYTKETHPDICRSSLI